ncbi:hypothetical protein [Ureibacillus sinduriensis]|uniref:NEAT domain-containing protein n=1 Tax=Ureibacillus sinduriensis BLB-1 = JCM 15800 TaxID=1384057 RepID=A0A0A3I1L7_9BACL|nr:hypothetical protein [Ureibacillus sinduriensis]KGR78624.1 hypothetical protein CD33_01165 [Ureibacillus sinduriensis BLB-1 = JCM 15800]
MKKLLSFLTLTFFFSMAANTLAAEDRPTIPYFGVGAVVQEMVEGEYLVKTEGAKAEEGFIYTPPNPFTKDNIKFLITLKGKGTVILKLEETNARGQYIKEKKVEVRLTEDWVTHEVAFTLESPSSQIDASVLTQDKEKAEFSFKNVQIIEE